MRRDALQTLKASLAGTATTRFLDVLEAAFGVAEAEDEVPEIQPTSAEAEGGESSHSQPLLLKILH